MLSSNERGCLPGSCTFSIAAQCNANNQILGYFLCLGYDRVASYSLLDRIVKVLIVCLSVRTYER